MVIGQTYWFQVDRALYLPTTAVASYQDHQFRLAGSTVRDSRRGRWKVVTTVVLLGGDATNDNAIESGDAGCIGARYGRTPQACGTGGTSDVNEDLKMDILDLTLMGGNFGKTASPAPATWAP